jgi:hypothetical protein
VKEAVADSTERLWKVLKKKKKKKQKKMTIVFSVTSFAEDVKEAKKGAM